MKTGEAITRLLGLYGVRYVFGVPGTHSLELYRGLAGEKHGVRHVLARHEQGAGFMADGYARITGRPGVCFVITGAGVTNIATPMGEAYSDSVPLLVVSPVNSPDGAARNRGRLHEISDQAAVTAPLSAFSATAQAASEIPDLVSRAFAIFAGARPRPVHISVPLPVLGQEVGGSWEPLDIPPHPCAGDDDIDRAVRAIDAARSPVIVAGGGMRFAADAVIGLAEAIGCPVITTVAGRGVVPASHAQCAGAQLRAAPVQELLAESDLAILLGTELAETDHWNDRLPLPNAQVRVNLDDGALIAPGEVMAMRADAADAAGRMSRRVSATQRAARLELCLSRCGALRRALPRSMTAKERRHWEVIEQLVRRLPDGTTVYSDMTQIAYTAIGYLPLERPNSWHHPTGYGALGYALPAALGGAIAFPERPVLAVAGDAGLQYTMQELSLASEMSLDVKLLLWNNDALEQIRDDMIAAGIPPTGVSQRNPDFGLLARASGWAHAVADRLEGLDEMFAWLFSRPGPRMLELKEKLIFPKSR